MKHSRLSVGNIEFRDPLLLCGVLYVLLFFDASGFLRLGLLAAALHELGHIIVYCAVRHRLPKICVTMCGFCMRTLGEALSPRQQLLLAAAGPGMNILLSVVWAAKNARCATVSDSAFLAANVLTGAFNLLPIPPLDGAQIIASMVILGYKRPAPDCISGRDRVQ